MPISSQIIGMDFGTQWIKIAEFQNQKGFVILEDKMAKRKTHNIVSFCNGHPSYEYQGYQSYFKKNCKSFSGTNTFLYTNDQDIVLDQTGQDYKLQIDGVNKRLIFQDKEFSKILQQKNDISNLSVEEIQALILKNIKSNIKSKSKTIPPQLMMTVPSNELNIMQRKSIKFIQQLSGFTPLGIIHENSSAALYYTYDRLKNTTFKNQKLFIINIGHRSTKLSLFSINNNKKNNQQLLIVKAQKHFNSDQFSGDVLDQCLSQQIANLKDQNKQKKRQAYKAIEDTKIKLSVNKEQKISINDFLDGKKFSKVVNRKNFHESCKERFENLKQILTQFKQENNVDWQSVNIQVIGGVVRVPKVKNIIQQIFQQQPNIHINGDDGAVLGATLMATKIVLSNYEQSIMLRENLNYTYQIQFEDQQPQAIFKNSTYYGQEVQFEVPYKQELKFKIQDTLQNQVISYQLKKVDIQNLKSANISFSMFIDFFGLFQIKELKLIGVQEVEKDGVKSDKNIIRLLDYAMINIDNKSILDDKENLTQSRRLIKKITYQEEQKQYMGKIRNELESLLFQGKEILKENEKQKYLTKEEINNMEKKVKQIKKFVESEDFSFDDEKINKKIEQMKQVLSPYKLRSSEEKLRANIIEEHDQFLLKCLQIINNVQQLRYWVPPYLISEQQQVFRREIEKFEIQKTKQQKLKINEDPVIISEELKQKKEFLKNHLQQLTTFPKNRKIESFHNLLHKFVKTHQTTMEELMKKQLKKIKNSL